MVNNTSLLRNDSDFGFPWIYFLFIVLMVTSSFVNEFIPTCYIDISDVLESKLEAINIFKSQISDFPNARSLETIKALAQ